MKTLITIFCLAISTFIFGQTKIENVDAPAFKKFIDAKSGELIDLRTTDEIKNKGMIKGAVQIDFLDKNAEATILKLDKNKTYLIYCAGGGRSGDCAEFMEKQGFKHVVNLAKGFDDWKKKGFEVELKK
ncbi:MAG: rhodanese-like domain-containing protein [Bacteroidetes bacterium]|nr:rhodanese-like domain-containing protein [Bacteroidota bacterium]